MGKSLSRLRFELATKSGHEFQNLFGSLLGELLDGAGETKKLGRLDQQGVDVFVVASDDEGIKTTIQCKGFERGEYGIPQQRQCRREIAKYRSAGPPTPEYWLVINRPIKDRALRVELERDLDALVQIGKAAKVELLDQEPMLKRLRELADARLAAWSGAKREELFEYYVRRLGFVEYIEDVPFNDPMKIGPTDHIFAEIQAFFHGLPEHQTGKYRPAPKVLVTSAFGFGKTSTLHALSRLWMEAGGHVLYAPAALLEDAAFVNSSQLADAMLALVLPDDMELSGLGTHVFPDTLRDTLRKSKDWLVLIDGLDENAAAFKPNNLVALWHSIRVLGIPAVLSARDELVETRNGEFFPDAALEIAPNFERIRLQDWPDHLIARFVTLFRAARGGEEPPTFRAFRELIESRRYNELYGDIPKRPLFLGMLAQDAWSGDEPAQELHRLYGKYFARKFSLDRTSLAAGGAARRPSAILEAFGADEAALTTGPHHAGRSGRDV